MAIQFHGTFHGLKITNCTLELQHITDWIRKFSVKSIVTLQNELLTKILFFLNLIFLVNNSMGKNFNIILDLVTNSRLFLKKIKFQSY